ncbi:hypothetical protein LTR13_011421 [Exophiala sideris]|nr:hypothetical protein LTR13_011421 [Exophiala sideris]
MSGYVDKFKMPPRLFTPLRIGDIELSHRLILAPCTRCRSPEQIPGQLNIEYYSQRATKGGLLIIEATFISPGAGSFARVPGIVQTDQIEGWKKVTSAVHAKEGYIFLQLWYTGRSRIINLHVLLMCPLINHPQARTNDWRDVPFAQPTGLEDMHQVCSEYAQAASNVSLQSLTESKYTPPMNTWKINPLNDRQDEFGGSIENRARFPLMIVNSLIQSVGAHRVAIRLSPFGNVHGAADSDPYTTWGYVCREIEKRKIAYVHLVEPRHQDLFQSTEQKLNFLKERASRMGRDLEDALTLRPFKQALKSMPVLVAGGGLETASNTFLDSQADALAFGRFFIANADLPLRLQHGLPLNVWKPDLFYTPGSEGYLDYPTATV